MPRRGRKVFTTSPAGGLDRRPDLVERNFTAAGPNQLWVADITYVRIPSGFCYTAFITDVFTRRIVGWAAAASLHTEALPLQALEQALQTTPAEASRTGLIHDSDRGSNYVLLAYSDALITAGVQASVGSVKDSYDNALAETVNGLYEAELIHRRRIWPSATAVEIATLDWVTWWNAKRLHEALGFRTPAEVEAAYAHRRPRQRPSNHGTKPRALQFSSVVDTNENTNGLIREYLPKGTYITSNQAYLTMIADELNDRPRASSGFYAPREKFEAPLGDGVA